MDHLDRIALLLAAGIICFVLFVPPVVGLADNGDFCKICSRFDIYLPNHTGLDRANYADTTYTFDPMHRWWSEQITPEIPIAWVAVRLNSIFSFFNPKTFDMRWMGVVHGALYLLVFYLALPLMRGLSKIRRVILLTVILLILGDIMYVSALSSFYMDTAAWIFLCLSVVFYLRTLRWPTDRHRLALLISLLLLTTAKTQHIAAGFALGVLMVVTRRQLGYTRAWRRRVVAFAAVSIALAWLGTPQGYTSIPVFNTIFYEVLPHSDNVHRDLAEFGLDDSYARWNGMHTYTKGSPMSNDDFVREFKRRTSQFRIAAFYARHPAKTWQMFIAATALAGHQRPYLGNFDRRLGVQEKESGKFSGWSSLKRALFWRHGELYLAYVLGLLALLLVLTWKSPSIRAAVVAFGVLTILELLIASLGDVMDTLRHEWVFNGLTDLAVVFIVALLVGTTGRNPGIQEEQVAAPA